MFDTQKIADTYDQIALNFSATRQKLPAEISALIPSLPEKTSVLDLGCGNGVLLTALPKRVNYTGFDISREMISEAKRLATGSVLAGKFIVADITKEDSWASLPQYDFIAALAVLHHLPTEQEQLFVLKKVRDHLKPDSVALISVWRLDQPRFDKYRTGKHLSIPFHGGISRDFYSFSDSELISLLEKSGLSVKQKVMTKDNLYFLCYSSPK